MASVTGSRLAFYSSTVSADKVNVVLTADGSDVAGKAISGNFNIEVFTVTGAALASGFQASAYVQGAQRRRGRLGRRHYLRQSERRGLAGDRCQRYQQERQPRPVRGSGDGVR